MWEIRTGLATRTNMQDWLRYVLKWRPNLSPLLPFFCSKHKQANRLSCCAKYSRISIATGPNSLFAKAREILRAAKKDNHTKWHFPGKPGASSWCQRMSTPKGQIAPHFFINANNELSCHSGPLHVTSVCRNTTKPRWYRIFRMAIVWPLNFVITRQSRCSHSKTNSMHATCDAMTMTEILYNTKRKYYIRFRNR